MISTILIVVEDDGDDSDILEDGEIVPDSDSDDEGDDPG